MFPNIKALFPETGFQLVLPDGYYSLIQERKSITVVIRLIKSQTDIINRIGKSLFYQMELLLQCRIL